jgi:hypothetical protein
MLDRRAFMLASTALLMGARNPARALLDRAIAAAGGRRALLRARVLRWTGTAVIHDGARSIRIGVDTLCEPFARAVSKSWLLSDGPAKSRTMILKPGGAWIVRGGERTPMPETMRVHETQQFAIYGLMRLVDLTEPGATVRREGNALRVRHPKAPEALLRFDEQARLVALEDEVAAPDGGGAIPQHFAFRGRMPARWHGRG